jgi:hypothetical protein
VWVEQVLPWKGLSMGREDEIATGLCGGVRDCSMVGGTESQCPWQIFAESGLTPILCLLEATKQVWPDPLK